MFWGLKGQRSRSQNQQVVWRRRRGCGRHGMPPPTCNNPTSQGFIAMAMAVDSAFSNRLLSLKFAGDTLSVSALIGLVTLTFDLLTSNPVLVMPVRWATFLTTLMFWELFILDLWAKPTHVRRITWPCDLDLWPWRSRRFSVFVLRLCTKLEVRRPSRSEDMINVLPISALVGLVTLTFDLWPWNWCTLLPVGWITLVPILVFIRRFILDLSANTCQTRYVNLRPWSWKSRHLSLMRVFALSLCTKFDLCRPLRSEDIGHLLCEH